MMMACLKLNHRKYVYVLPCNFKKALALVIISGYFLSYVTAESDNFVVQEGEVADVYFSYKTKVSVEFEIKAGHEDPFYKHGQVMVDRISPSRQKRLRVYAKYSVIKGQMLVHLQFLNAERTDAGTYTCNFMQNGNVIIEKQVISLSVDFPPGSAECWLLSRTELDCDILQCAAIGGSPSGQISCFQNNQKSTLDEVFTSNETHILQTFWVNTKVTVFCCSHSDGLDVQSNNCDDFVKLVHTSTEQYNGNLITDLYFTTSQKPSQFLVKPTCGPNALNVSKAVNVNLKPTPLILYILPSVLVIVCAIIIIVVIYCKFRHSGMCGELNENSAVPNGNQSDMETVLSEDNEIKFNDTDMQKSSEMKREEDEPDPTNEEEGLLKIGNAVHVKVNTKPQPPITTEHKNTTEHGISNMSEKDLD